LTPTISKRQLGKLLQLKTLQTFSRPGAINS
jgi:hypothetical protein